MKTGRIIILFLLPVFFVFCSMKKTDDHPILHAEATITLPGVKGRIDHMAYDRSGQRMFICALGNNTVEVVDLKNEKIIYSIKSSKEAQGVVYDSIGKRIFVTSGADGFLRTYNSENYSIQDSLYIGSDADNIRFEPGHQLYIGYDGGIASVDISTRKISTLKTDGHVESFQLDAAKGKLFANVPDADEVEVFDLKNSVSPMVWRLKNANDNFPMALAPAAHAVIIACRHPAKLFVLNDSTGSIISSTEISSDADDIFYDDAHALLFASCGEGSVDVFSKAADMNFKIAEKSSSRMLARTSFFSQTDMKFFLAVPSVTGKPAELRIFSVVPPM